MLRPTPILATVLLFGCITINKDADDDDGDWGDESTADDPSSLFDTDDDVDSTNAAPTVAITSHANGDAVLEGEEVSLRGVASDANDAADSLSATWTMNDEVVCESSIPDADGTTVCTTALWFSDTVTIGLEVRDPEGAATVATVTLTLVATEAPIAEITAPTGAEVYRTDEPITLAGIISDAEDSPEELTAVWESSIEGVLVVDSAPTSEGSISDTVNLSEGEHALTLTVTDTQEKTGSDAVFIAVWSPDP